MPQLAVLLAVRLREMAVLHWGWNPLTPILSHTTIKSSSEIWQLSLQFCRQKHLQPLSKSHRNFDDSQKVRTLSFKASKLIFWKTIFFHYRLNWKDYQQTGKISNSLIDWNIFFLIKEFTNDQFCLMTKDDEQKSKWIQLYKWIFFPFFFLAVCFSECR